MMAFVVQRLNDGIRATLMAHFLALPMKDRSLRFGRSLAPTVIAAYVDGIDFGRDVVFGVYDSQFMLIGEAHMAIRDDLAEVALSVLPVHRSRGVGNALFNHALVHARNHCIPKLFMHCQSGNAPIIRIAQRFGMNIIASGGDAYAQLNLQRAPMPAEIDEPADFGPLCPDASL
jgi:GNAT superfamily N-acetyltransferase